MLSRLDDVQFEGKGGSTRQCVVASCLHTQTGTRIAVYFRVLQCVVASRNDASVEGEEGSALASWDNMSSEGEGCSVRRRR